MGAKSWLEALRPGVLSGGEQSLMPPALVQPSWCHQPQQLPGPQDLPAHVSHAQGPGCARGLNSPHQTQSTWHLWGSGCCASRADLP